VVTSSSHEDDDLSAKMSLPSFRGPGELYPYFTNEGCWGGVGVDAVVPPVSCEDLPKEMDRFRFQSKTSGQSLLRC